MTSDTLQNITSVALGGVVAAPVTPTVAIDHSNPMTLIITSVLPYVMPFIISGLSHLCLKLFAKKPIVDVNQTSDQPKT